jgi:hypothetical protein
VLSEYLRGVRSVFSTIFMAALACGQDAPVTVIHAGPDTRQASMVSWQRGNPTFDLVPQGPGSRSGHIWVSNSANGLLIEGEVDGPKPTWPATMPEMLSKDHVEVWLAAAPKVELPPIGWGNQFGETDLKSEADCATTASEAPAGNPDKCKNWFRKQVRYREQFKRLFVRQWLLERQQVVETYAHAAMQNLMTNFSPDMYVPTEIAPVLKDGVRMVVMETAKDKPGYGFQVTIPYSAFPPVPTLQVRDLWLMVDVFSSTPEGRKMGAFSTTSRQRRWGDASTFNHLRLERPSEMKLSPCGYPLTQQDLYGVNQATFIYPVPVGTAVAETVVIDKVVSVMNPAGGYLYDPVGASPSAESRQVFSKSTGHGAFVCGPKLAYMSGAASVKTDNILNKEGFDAKVLPDGWTLVKTGPRADYSAFGSGECGACPRAQLQVYAISPQGKVEPALDVYELVGNDTAAADFYFAPDWSRAVYYREANSDTATAAAWTATSYCLKGHTYERCGKNDHARPPNPPVVKALRGEP